jgi:hypothetical protein
MGVILIALQGYYREEYRRQINTLLNKGQTLHSLRKYLLVANEAQASRRTCIQWGSHYGKGAPVTAGCRNRPEQLLSD